MEIKKTVLDILFPLRCLVCQEEGSLLCQKCASSIRPREVQLCPTCENHDSVSGKICRKCQEKYRSSGSNNYLDYLVSASHYKRDGLDKLVHLFKYRFIKGLSIPLGMILLDGLIRNDIPIPDLIIPVPLHKKRLRWRGFNQAELLAEEVSKALAPGLEIPLETGLIKRVRYFQPQMKIGSYESRFENIKDSFSLCMEEGPSQIKNRHILLIDDISTTGATLFECAKILRENGARKIGAGILARQESISL